MTAAEKIKEMGIVPVVVIENEKDAVPQERWRRHSAKEGFLVRR